MHDINIKFNFDMSLHILYKIILVYLDATYRDWYQLHSKGIYHCFIIHARLGLFVIILLLDQIFISITLQGFYRQCQNTLHLSINTPLHNTSLVLIFASQVIFGHEFYLNNLLIRIIIRKYIFILLIPLLQVL